MESDWREPDAAGNYLVYFKSLHGKKLNVICFLTTFFHYYYLVLQLLLLLLLQPNLDTVKICIVAIQGKLIFNDMATLPEFLHQKGHCDHF